MKKPQTILFIILIAAQLSVPVYLIVNRELVLRTGRPFHFRTKPVDPYDAFRGRYVSLAYDFTEAVQSVVEKKYKKNIILPNNQNADDPDKDSLHAIHNNKFYVSLKKDKKGFAVMDTVGENPPDHDDYVTVTADCRWGLRITNTFDRFYLDEFDAPEAERAYVQTVRDREKEAYAVVNVKKGETVLNDLMLEGLPIREYLRKNPPDKTPSPARR